MRRIEPNRKTLEKQDYGRKIVIQEQKNQFHTFGKDDRLPRLPQVYEDSDSESSSSKTPSSSPPSSYDSDVLERRDRQSDDGDESMDYIEKRIMKLEVELQKKLQKSRSREGNLAVVKKEQVAPKPKASKNQNIKMSPPDDRLKKQTTPEKLKSSLRQKSPGSTISQAEYESIRREAQSLRKQNQVLKKKLEEKQSHKKGLSRERRELIEIDQIISNAQTTKLQKEVELLDLLQNIRHKLKKSIRKKMANLQENDRLRMKAEKALQAE